MTWRRVSPHKIPLEQRYKIDPVTGCWLWQTGINHKGYGLLWTKAGTVSAYRYMYKLLKGEIPEGLVLHHLCRTRCCVNPEHLKIVTYSENNANRKTYTRRRRIESNG